MPGIPVVFFLAAGAALLVGPKGLLTWPGLAAAAAGTLFSVRNKYFWAAVIGAGSATVSVAAQTAFGFCAWCGLAAGFFAAAGLGAVAASGNLPRRLGAAALVLAAAVAAGSFLAYAVAGPGGVRAVQPLPAVAGTAAGGSVTTTAEADRPSTSGGKAVLYISPWCPNCERALRVFIGRDPTGTKWEPVVVPQSDLRAGEEKLRALGYTGDVRSEASVPAEGVPYLRSADGRGFLGATRCLEWAQSNL
ncbi:hypothetical protein MTAT_16570 [Moorella thermoacetica]|uniref:Glutaredoxin domain-containing protein n=1 Tax=Neomoorella thermoacetica TaxID=1525 RepID=A0AAC9HFP7_NEOTH|nr:hypothetical protein Maut_00664 [Moorella thermoacetica]TYL12834.1 hypothetical protein MTAT_16570 [Moorella thermoacetica]